MPKNLLIVESPAKAKTIEKILGKDYTVKSSFGHVRDLDKGDGAVDVERNFATKYVVSPEKRKVVKELKAAVSKVDTVWLATDEDREGEAISWHLCEVLKLPVDSTKRIVFREITPPAIQAAINNPRTVDVNLVNAQQARRVLPTSSGSSVRKHWYSTWPICTTATSRKRCTRGNPVMPTWSPYKRRTFSRQVNLPSLPPSITVVTPAC